MKAFDEASNFGMLYNLMVHGDYVCKFVYITMTLFLTLYLPPLPPSFPFPFSLSLSPLSLPPVSSNFDIVVGLSSSPSSPSTPALPEFLSQLQVQGNLVEGEGQRSAEGASLVDQCSDLYNRARYKDGVSYTLSVLVIVQCMIVI